MEGEAHGDGSFLVSVRESPLPHKTGLLAGMCLQGFAYLFAGGFLIYMFSEPFINAVVEVGEGVGINPGLGSLLLYFRVAEGVGDSFHLECLLIPLPVVCAPTRTGVLAFFLAPIASEAPEILESVTLSMRGKTQNINIALSNLIGGTISKTTLLLGVRKKVYLLLPC